MEEKFWSHQIHCYRDFLKVIKWNESEYSSGKWERWYNNAYISWLIKSQSFIIQYRLSPKWMRYLFGFMGSVIGNLFIMVKIDRKCMAINSIFRFRVCCSARTFLNIYISSSSYKHKVVFKIFLQGCCSLLFARSKTI